MKTWDKVPLVELCRPRQWPTLSKAEMLDFGIPVYGANGIIGYTDRPTHTQHTILIGCRGSCGTVHVLEPPAYANGNAMALDDLRVDRVSLRFLQHFFQFRGFADVTTGASQPQIVQRNLNQIEIPVPPLEEQKRIAAILDQADELRRKRQRALDRLNQLGQAIFIEMFGDPASNPMGWPKVALADCCAEPDDIRCGPFGTQLLREEFQETGVPLWGIKQVNKAFSITTHEYVNQKKATELSNYDIIADDIVMTRKGTIGNCAIYPDSFPPGVMHSDLLRVRLDRAKAVPQFIADQLHYSRDVERQIELISGGAIMQGINVGKLKRIGVLLPTFSLQARYSARLVEVGLQISAMKGGLGKSETLFASLQHRAFRGELTASSLEEAAA